MRRLLHMALLLVAALSVACSPHEFPGGGSGAQEQDFSLKILFDEELPIQQQIVPTKEDGIADDVAQPRYTLWMWRYENDIAFGVDPDYCYTFTRSALDDLETTLYLPILPAKYRMAVWVDWTGGDAGTGYDLSDPEHIVFPPEFPIGERARDAFTLVTDYDVKGYLIAGETYQKTVTLHRPVAQLRIVAPEALTFLALAGLDPTQMRATLRYPDPIPDGYDILLGTTNGSRSDVVLTGTPRYDISGELVFISDFIFFPDAAGSIPVEFTLTDLSGKELIVYSGNIPLRGSHKTTVAFDMPYGGADKPGGIGISPGFDDEIEITID